MNTQPKVSQIAAEVNAALKGVRDSLAGFPFARQEPLVQPPPPPPAAKAYQDGDPGPSKAPITHDYQAHPTAGPGLDTACGNPHNASAFAGNQGHVPGAEVINHDAASRMTSGHVGRGQTHPLPTPAAASGIASRGTDHSAPISATKAATPPPSAAPGSQFTSRAPTA